VERTRGRGGAAESGFLALYGDWLKEGACGGRIVGVEGAWVVELEERHHGEGECYVEWMLMV